MIFRQLNSSGDWTFGAGLGNYASGTQAIALNIQTSVLMWQNDFFASLAGWVNWKGLQNVGTANPLSAALQTLLANAYGVMGVVSASVSVNPTTRALSASYVVNTVYSTQIVNDVQILSGQSGGASA
jgi:hypothetical protein